MGRLRAIQIRLRELPDVCWDGLVSSIQELERWIAGERTTLLGLVHQDKLRALVAQSHAAFVKSEQEMLDPTGSKRNSRRR